MDISHILGENKQVLQSVLQNGWWWILVSPITTILPLISTNIHQSKNNISVKLLMCRDDIFKLLEFVQSKRLISGLQGTDEDGFYWTSNSILILTSSLTAFRRWVITRSFSRDCILILLTVSGDMGGKLRYFTPNK